jgi:hypothetical protein
VDFAPVLGLVVIFLAAEGIAYQLWRLYIKLPF